MRLSRILLFAMFLVPQAGFSGVIALVTDQSSLDAAKELKSLIERSTCFKDMKSLEIKIKQVSSSELGECKTEPQASRYVVCDSTAASGFAAELNADKVVVLKESGNYGGSSLLGGISATALTGSPATVGLHELLHTFGFLDEYAYVNTAEANAYCGGDIGSPNVAIFKDSPPYSSDADARARHSSQIPWSNQITAKLITTLPDLGTPEPRRIGLYHAKACEKATTGFKAWRPGDDSKPNIMESIGRDTFIPQSFCPTIRQALGEDGGAGATGASGGTR